MTMGCYWGTGEERIGDKIAGSVLRALVVTGGLKNCRLEGRPQLLSAGLTDAET